MAKPLQMWTRLVAFCRRRGSALMAAFLFSMFVFVVLGSLMPMVVNDYESSVQNRLYNVAYAAAEAGADEVMWGLNHHRFEDAEWEADGWSSGEDFYGDAYWVKEIRLPEDQALGESDLYAGQHQAVIRVVVGRPDASASSHEYAVYSKAEVTDTRTGRAATRVIAFTATLGSPFRGLIAKDEVDYNALMDSYNSDNGPYGLPASNALRDNATLGTLSTDAEKVAVSLGPLADIRGQVVSGAENAANVDYARSAQISGGIHDGFEADFPVVSAPDSSDITAWKSHF